MIKNFWYAICLTTALLLGLALLPAPAAAQGGGYTVQPGDTLYGISVRHNISVAQLAQANGLAQGGWLQQGQQLIIPSAVANSNSFAVQPAAYTAPAPTQRPQAAPYGYANDGWTTLNNNAPPTTNYAPQAPAWPNRTDSPFARPQALPQPIDRFGQNTAPYQPATIQQAAPPSRPQRYQTHSLGIPPVAPSPGPVTANGKKWIDINLSTQMLTAFEGQTPVFRAMISSGLAQYPTVAGTYPIYVKYEQTDMSGGSGADAYHLEDVPYVMYFHGSYGLHGTYWHNNFGTPMSHGCVNLTIPDSQWLYNWATVGVPVVTHY